MVLTIGWLTAVRRSDRGNYKQKPTKIFRQYH